MSGIVAGITAVHRLWRKPQTRRNHLRGNPFAVQPFLQLPGFLANLRLGLAVNVGHGVVIMKHHGVKSVLLELRQLPIKRLWLPGRRPVRILPFAEIPWPKTKTVLEGFWHNEGAS